MPAIGMSHVAFCVRDMEKSLAFYQGALGFRVLNDRRQDTTTGGLPTSTNTGAPRGGR